MLIRPWSPSLCMSMNDSTAQLRAQLAAAQETIKALSKRMHQLERGDSQLPLQHQLKFYRKRIEEKTTALQTVQSWFELIVQNAMDAIVRVDQNGRIQSWNPMAERMFGYRSNDVMGRLIEDILIPEQLRKAHLSNFRRHLSRGRGALMNKRIEGLALCKDGSKMPVEFIGSVVKQGDTRAFVMTLRDISERIAAEQALRDSHANLEAQVQARTRELHHLAAIIEATINSVVIADLQGHVYYVNPAGREMLSLAQDMGLDALSFEDFHSPEFRQCLADKVLPQTLQQGVFETECEFMDQHGNGIPVTCIYMFLSDEQGQADRLAVIARDMRREIALQQQVEHVDRLESLGILAGGIAHDFNNILTAIIGNAGLAMRKVDAGLPAQKYLQGIEQASMQAAKLCKQMLAYSGKGSREIQPVDLSGLITDMRSLLEVSVDKRAVLKFDLCETLPVIDADITQIQQIIMNLVINGSEAMNKHSGTIAVSTGLLVVDEQYLQSALHTQEVSVGPFVYLTVSDTGCGMDAGIMKKIFDPFFTTKFTGRGLGMSAVLGIVHGHHGIVKIDSVLGQGTTFNMAFPISASHAPSADSQAYTAACNPVFGMVLVVDDEQSIREVAAVVLEEMGYMVALAIDGKDGVEVFRKHHKAIVGVILDMTMPRMDGKECYHELCKIDPDVRVILSSGYGEEDAVDRFQSMGLAGFIQKPYHIAHFQRVVSECFGSG